MFGEKHQSEMAVLVLDVCIILQVYFYLSYDRIFLKSINKVLEEYCMVYIYLLLFLFKFNDWSLAFPWLVWAQCPK